MRHLLPNMSPRWKSRWVFLDIYLFVLVEKASDWPLTKDYREIHWLSQGMPLWALGEVCPVGLPFTSINPIYWLLTYKGYNHVTGATRNIYPGGPKKEKKKQRTLFFGNWLAPFLVHRFWTWHSKETERWLSLSAVALPLDNPEGKFIHLTTGACAQIPPSWLRIQKALRESLVPLAPILMCFTTWP